jgi:RimJ/RimL family protein N-acetyltransferase
MTAKPPAQDPILIDLPMPIETPRLILRPNGGGFSNETVKAIKESWLELHRWMDWAVSLDDVTEEKQEIRARTCEAKFILREELNLVAFEKESGRPVVWTGLHNIDWPNRCFYTGYWTRASACGKGYATESTNALLRYAFNVLGAQRVGITHSDGNEASRRVIEKLGFAKEGVARLGGKTPAGLVDQHCYARLDGEGLPALDVRWGPK